LAGVMADIFKDITGRTMKIEEMHAGIECGFHHKSNPNLDIVSIGTTNEEIHSPRERLKLSTVAPITRLIARTLVKIGNI
ncbi:MAG: aminoacyl-histidine dipeptidase, partial [Selenomonadaceae bacterium]|nr:aminoacyl-histidine dipeptidase [Selenomonadaceae bacterium]